MKRVKDNLNKIMRSKSEKISEMKGLSLVCSGLAEVCEDLKKIKEKELEEITMKMNIPNLKIKSSQKKEIAKNLKHIEKVKKSLDAKKEIFNHFAKIYAKLAESENEN